MRCPPQPLQSRTLGRRPGYIQKSSLRDLSEHSNSYYKFGGGAEPRVLPGAVWLRAKGGDSANIQFRSSRMQLRKSEPACATHIGI